MSITNSQQLSIQITDCPRTEAVAPFFRMEGTEWWRHNTPLILLCETLERENAALRADKERLNWMQTITGSEWAYCQLVNNLGLTRYDIDVARKKEAQP